MSVDIFICISVFTTAADVMKHNSFVASVPAVWTGHNIAHSGCDKLSCVGDFRRPV